MISPKWSLKTTIKDNMYIFTYTSRDNNDIISGMFPVIQDNGYFIYAESEYIGLPTLVPPLFYTKDNKIVSYFINRGSKLVGSPIYKPNNYLILLLEPDIQLIKEKLNIDPNTEESDSIFENIDISPLVSKENEFDMYRVLTMRDRVLLSAKKLCYNTRLEYSDLLINMGRVYRGKYVRQDKVLPIAKEVLRSQILIPSSGEHVYKKGIEYYVDTLSTPQSALAGKVVCLCDGARIANGRIEKGKSIFAKHINKVIAFPHLIEPERIPIIHATVTQTINIVKPEKPLVLPNKSHSDLPGRNVFIALMDAGYTSNDGIIISKKLANSLESIERVRQRIIIPKHGYSILIKKGDIVLPGQTVCTYLSDEIVNIASNTNIISTVEEIVVKDLFVGNVDMRIVLITYKEQYKLVLGSKVSGLHSNKHIVSKILPDEMMPKGVFGTADAIVSPSTVGKRLNLSYLAEGAYGHSARYKGTIYIQPFSGKSLPDEIRKAYELSKGVTPYKIDPNFMFDITFLDRQLPNKVFVGYHFLSRLEHHPQRKLRFSNRLTVDRNLRCIYNGMQRLSLNELEVLIAKRGDNIIQRQKLLKYKNTNEYKMLLDILNATKILEQL